MTPEEKQERKSAFNQRIAERIIHLRKQAGMNQAQLADRAGIGRTHLTRIESGAYEVTGWVLQAIAEAMDMTVDVIDPRLQNLDPLRPLT